MESFEESNCPSLSDSFSLYERYMRSFNVVDHFNANRHEISDPSSNCESSNSGGNIDLSTVIHSNVDNHQENIKLDSSPFHNILENEQKLLDLQLAKYESSFPPTARFLSENSSATSHCLNEKSEITGVPVTSEDSKSEGFKSVFITSNMENSNNAVDSVPMFRDVKTNESVFKLPISELSFNGTILKHVQKLKPIVDPMTALSTANSALNLSYEQFTDSLANNLTLCTDYKKSVFASDSEDKNTSESLNIDKLTMSSVSHQDEEDNSRKELQNGSSKSDLDPCYSSLDASYDSGMRSPDIFSDEDDVEPSPQEVPFWDFVKDHEIYDKKRARKIEEALRGILPPPSVTTLKTDVTEMLKKYYCFLPIFNGEENLNVEANSMTPTKKVSFIKIPVATGVLDDLQEIAAGVSLPKFKSNKLEMDGNTSKNDKSIDLKICSETEAMESQWPDLLKCNHYDIYYNLTSHSEKIEQLLQRYAERYVGAETDTSVNIYSGGLQSPSSACKRKAMRLKLAQGKSPGRRLSHLARRRQAFASAATINERAQASTARMVLIDKNFFPHRKLINTSERKSPRTRRTPGKNIPIRKTPGKKTPAKTPKSGGSSRKKAMRRLLLDSESLSKSQPSRETSKRALFISPENKRTVPVACSSVPHQAMKSKRALFGSPVREAETKSLDGTTSDHFLKRKLDYLDDVSDNNRSKIAKSLSFGGDSLRASQPVMLNRRASERPATNCMIKLNETHKKKLLWAVTEALRLHGWRMSSPGFREKASALARLTRKLFTLPPHAAKLAAPQLSTSDTMFKLARQYVFAIIQGRTVEECFQDEQIKLANEKVKITGYISASAYQQLKNKQVTSTFTSQIKENTCNEATLKQEQPRSGTKNVLQDKLVNIDSNSNSSSGFSVLEKTVVYKSNSMPSFEEAAKMRARRQISFDTVDFPKR
ncbi:uncharacterized protein LOC123661398 [Melitaea cinxia]|uniref:uncharacterized protein LOC123661398 n=1 Tax=Melitaea cinxia TaxID=113334 RepID=UPI001E270808|nr:uncharacterized protein LOC123661398 [Melitaea cinxia]